jgi:hypothetical protein
MTASGTDEGRHGLSPLIFKGDETRPCHPARRTGNDRAQFRHAVVFGAPPTAAQYSAPVTGSRRTPFLRKCWCHWRSLAAAQIEEHAPNRCICPAVESATYCFTMEEPEAVSSLGGQWVGRVRSAGLLLIDFTKSSTTPAGPSAYKSLRNCSVRPAASPKCHRHLERILPARSGNGPPRYTRSESLNSQSLKVWPSNSMTSRSKLFPSKLAMFYSPSWSCAARDLTLARERVFSASDCSRRSVRRLRRTTSSSRTISSARS